MKESTKNDSGKAPYHLVSPVALAEMVEVLRQGAEEYGEQNWLDDDPEFEIRLMAAIDRHKEAMRDGELVDPKSGCLHSSHIMAGAMMLAHRQLVGSDDWLSNYRGERGLSSAMSEELGGIKPSGHESREDKARRITQMADEADTNKGEHE